MKVWSGSQYLLDINIKHNNEPADLVVRDFDDKEFNRYPEITAGLRRNPAAFGSNKVSLPWVQKIQRALILQPCS